MLLQILAVEEEVRVKAVALHLHEAALAVQE
jgi:hypothetical protein